MEIAAPELPNSCELGLSEALFVLAPVPLGAHICICSMLVSRPLIYKGNSPKSWLVVVISHESALESAINVTDAVPSDTAVSHARMFRVS